MAPPYVSLHAHTVYSTLDGYAPVEEYVATVAAAGHTHAAITDHGTMAGAPDFVAACAKHNIVPIVGMEAYVHATGRTIKEQNNRHLTMLAINQQGYQNLMRLATEAGDTGFYYKPRVDWELLSKYHEGLVVLSGCVAGEVGHAVNMGDVDLADQTIDFYRRTFGDRFFLEIQNHGPDFEEQHQLNHYLDTVHRELGIVAVATNDSHFCAATDYESQQLLYKMRGMHGEFGSPYCFVRSNEEMAHAFNIPLMRNTLLIADMVTPYQLGTRQPKLPVSPLETDDPHRVLSMLSRSGIENRMGQRFSELPLVYRERLEYELQVVREKSRQLGTDLSRYFLVISDICQYCRDQQIRFGPRGSAAGSIICWAMQISEPNPIKEGLMFERFLNPERMELPDIDLDFADDRRDDVFAYIRDTYGAENVGRIGTISVIGARSAIKDAAKLYEQEINKYGKFTALADQLTKLIPHDTRPGGMPLHELMTMSEEPLVKRAETEPDVDAIIGYALKLEGKIRHESQHAGGVVIADRPLIDLVPLNTSRSKKAPVIKYQTQYEMQHLESLGLLKIDVLGLSQLSALDEAVKRINAIVPELMDDIDLWNLPWDDQPTWDLIGNGQTLGCFQIGTVGLTKACKELRPDTINDLAMTIAIYRPGPMQHLSDIAKRKHGRQPVESIHPAIDHILAETYGFPVYQEQVMLIAQTMAGYSAGQADLLRKAMGKKIREKMAEEQVKFFAGAAERGYSEAEAQHVWDYILPFADYGFNKAHAICYAYTAYQTAYLKANFPQSFYAAAMNTEAQTGDAQGRSKQQRVGELMREARALDVRALPPDVQFPNKWCEVDHGYVRVGLKCIKGINTTDVDKIISARRHGPFSGIVDFMQRTNVGAGTADLLARVGALPWHNRATLCDKETVIGPRGGKKIVSVLDQIKEGKDVEISERPEWTLERRLKDEVDHLGFFISDLPFKAEHNIAQIADDQEEYVNQTVDLLTVLMRVNHTYSKSSGLAIAYLELLDESGESIPAIVQSKVYSREEVREAISSIGTLLRVRGKVIANPDLKIMVDVLYQPEPEPVEVAEDPTDICVTATGQQAIDQLTKIFELADKYAGPHTVAVRYGKTTQVISVSKGARAIIESYL